MLRTLPYRDAATVHVRVRPERVLALVSDPAVLQALDARFPFDEATSVEIDGPRVDVRGRDDHLHLSFVMEPEGDGTRLCAAESVRPQNAAEATKHMLFPGRVHEEFEGGLQRLKALIEAIEAKAANPR